MRIALTLLALALAAPALAENDRRAELVGVYDGGQMEMAAGLELRADGRFGYGLSYGALDEQAEGRWTVDGDEVVLTTEPPVTPPVFLLVKDEPAPEGKLFVKLANAEVLGGLGMELLLVPADQGPAQLIRMNGDGRSPIDLDMKLVGVRPIFSLFNVVGDLVKLSGDRGHRLTFRFDPNDIGRADFRGTRLRIEKGALVMPRFDRTLRFRKQ